MTEPTISELLNRILSSAYGDKQRQGMSEKRPPIFETRAKEEVDSEKNHGFLDSVLDAFQSLREKTENQNAKPVHPLSSVASIIGDFLDSPKSESANKSAKTNSFSIPGVSDDVILDLIKAFGSSKIEQIKSALSGNQEQNMARKEPRRETCAKAPSENNRVQTYDAFTPQTPYSNRRYVLRESRQPVDGLWFTRDQYGEYYKAHVKITPSGQTALLVWDYNTGKSLSSPSLDLVDAPTPATNTAMDGTSPPQEDSVFMKTVKALNEMNKVGAQEDAYTPFRNSYLLRKSRQPVGDLLIICDDWHNPIFLQTHMKSPISGERMLFTWEIKTGKSLLMPSLDLVDVPQTEAQTVPNQSKTWRETVQESVREVEPPLAETAQGMTVSEIATIGDSLQIVPIGSGLPGAKRIEWRFKD